MYPGVLSEINTQLVKQNKHLGQYLKTNESIGYVVLDVDKRFKQTCCCELLKKVKAYY